MARMRPSTSSSLLRGHEVDLVENDDIRERDLVLRLGRVLEPVGQPLGIRDRHDRVETRGVGHVLIHEEGLGDRRRIGKAGGLDDDRVELALALHQAVEDADEIAAHGAADAPVVHLEHFLVGADHEFVVDADLAEFVDDHGVFLAVRLREDAVEKRGLAGAEIAGEDRDGDLVGHRKVPEPDLHEIVPASGGMTRKAVQLDRAALNALILCLIMSM